MRWCIVPLVGAMALMVACAAPAPTATPTTPAAAPSPTKAAPTPTKAPTATPTKMPLTKVSVVASTFETNLNYAAALVAKGKGYFPEEGLDIDWIAAGGGAKALAAVVGRSAHIALVAASDIVNAVSQGQPAAALAHVSSGRPYFMVVRKAVAEERGITRQMSLAEKGKAMKGLIFGASSPGSGTDAMTRLFLTMAGLDPDRDVEIAYVGSAAYTAAFDAGAIDVITTVTADATLGMVRLGKGVLVTNFAAGDVPGLGDILGNVAAGQRDEMKAQPAIYEAFTRGMWRAQKLIADNPKEAKTDLFKTPEFERMDSGLYEEYWTAFLPAFPKSPEITEKAFQATLEFASKVEGGPPLAVKFSDFYDAKFVETAKKQLGY